MTTRPPSEALPLPRPVTVSDVQHQGRHVDINATEDECRAVAKALGIPGVKRLHASLDLRPFGKDGLAVEGSIDAAVMLTCVVTAENFEEVVDQPVRIRFSPDGVSPDAPIDIEEILADPDAEDEPDLLTGNTVDLGAVVIEFMALALPAYPRRPGVNFEDGSEDGPSSAFSGLAAWKAKSADGE